MSAIGWQVSRRPAIGLRQPLPGAAKEGLMQQYSQRIRYGAFGYINDSDIMGDGGVLRAKMKVIGPT